MKKTKILFSATLIVLCLALLTSALASCDNGTGGNETTGGSTAEETTSATTEATTNADGEEKVEKFDYLNSNLSNYITVDSSDYADIDVTISSDLIVTDDHVTKYIDKERFQYKTKANDGAQVTDQAIKLGDSAFIYYTGYLDGEPFEGGSNATSKTPHELSIGSGNFVPGFEEGLIGVIPANTSLENPCDVPVTFPEDYYEDLAGKDVIFKVWVVYTVQYDIPELNEDYIKNTLKFNTDAEDVVAAYRDHVKALLEEESAEPKKNAILSEIFEILEKNTTVTQYPQAAVDYYYQQYMVEFNQYFAYYGAYYGCKTLEEFIPILLGLSEGVDWKEYTLEMCRNAVRSDLIIYSIAQKENITVTDEDYKNRIQYYLDYYAANGQTITEEKLIEQYGEDLIREDTHINKIYDYLISNTTVSYED